MVFGRRLGEDDRGSLFYRRGELLVILFGGDLENRDLHRDSSVLVPGQRSLLGDNKSLQGLHDSVSAYGSTATTCLY
jgi:hypothetical protein